MTKSSITRLHAIVHGRVQGVGFRYFVIDTASRFDITGWVRNRSNGTVEVVAEGTRKQLEDFGQAIKRGSRASKVTEVDLSWENASEEFTGFFALPTL